MLSNTLHLLMGIVVSLLTQPFYYIFLLAVLLHYRRQGILERRLFNIRVHIYAGRVLRTVVTGLVVGVLASLLMTGVGIHTSTELLWLLGGLIVILSLFRLRLAHLLDALALLSVLYVILSFMSGWQPVGLLGQIVAAIRNADWVGLFTLAVLLHIAEAVLFRLQAPRLSSPIVIEGKRGKKVGAYTMDVFWPVPLWLLVPSLGGWVLPWQPLYGGDVWSAGVALSLLPVMIGTSVLTQSELPQVKANIISTQLWQSSLVLIIVAVGTYWWHPLALLGIWIGVIWREYIVYKSRRQEAEQTPMYTQSLRGLRILDVIPGSPADELGIRAAEAIFKANGVKVHSPQTLHAALRINPAFCKLEILNREGEIKFMQRAIYAGDHHQLGMIFVPDDDAAVTTEAQRLNAFHLLRMPVVSRHTVRSTTVPSELDPDHIIRQSTPVVDGEPIRSRMVRNEKDNEQQQQPPADKRQPTRPAEQPPAAKMTTTNDHAAVDHKQPASSSSAKRPSLSAQPPTDDDMTGLPKRGRKRSRR
ncbi:PDZ domain-containing protein [Paenibacillus campi]|uniref:PDZ domain-containing protein n=1 Tax=Paenibacillus campi TaxID=3106031 RepID=UPI002AFF403A|nr:PDZ domain-containing protein [Paenibacillus sp. SGZ-1014]